MVVVAARVIQDVDVVDPRDVCAAVAGIGKSDARVIEVEVTGVVLGSVVRRNARKRQHGRFFHPYLHRAIGPAVRAAADHLQFDVFPRIMPGGRIEKLNPRPARRAQQRPGAIGQIDSHRNLIGAASAACQPQADARLAVIRDAVIRPVVETKEIGRQARAAGDLEAEAGKHGPARGVQGVGDETTVVIVVACVLIERKTHAAPS